MRHSPSPSPSPSDSAVAAAGVGAVAGTAATVAMSVLMLAAQKLGFAAEQPPEAIVEEALDSLDVDRSERTENALGSIAHLGFGSSCGAAYALLRRRFDTPGPGTAHGIGFGLALYGASYAGWIPALGILPPPSTDSSGRQGTMVAAHVVYGAVLGALVRRWRR